VEKNETPKGMERWYYFAAGVVVGVLVMLVIGEFQPASHPAQTAMPQQQQPGMQPGAPMQAPMGPSAADLAALQQLADGNPKDAQARLHYANALHDARMMPQAIEQYKKYLLINPSDPDARVDMGICYFESQDLQTAAAEMKKALTYAPKHQMAFFNLGIVTLSMGNVAEAQTWFKKTIDVDPTTETAKRAQKVLTEHAQLPKP
jgi:tetratricopeptide (TPR) repeat protein